jgi:surface polysaccharide O-acyltransferase-like enzyme
LRGSNRFLELASPAVLPIYILHQPIIIAIGYVMLDWTLGWWLEYPILLTTALIVLAAAYWFLRRLPLAAWLLGIKGKSLET